MVKGLHTHVLVLNVPPRLPLQLGHVLGFTGEVLHKHLLWRVSAAALRANKMQMGILAVARVMTKAALLEQTLMSGSTAMIFLTRVTGGGQ
jgi:hypothetical protein